MIAIGMAANSGVYTCIFPLAFRTWWCSIVSGVSSRKVLQDITQAVIDMREKYLVSMFLALTSTDDGTLNVASA